MDFLANENFPLPGIRRLRGAGHDVAAIASEESGISGEEVLERAVRESRVILTFDRDYGRLIFEFGLPAPPEEPAERLLDLLEAPDFQLIGSLLAVERDRLRRRPLPNLRAE